ncbi:hypothetical protein N7478_009588 [Penicillium angulare]|uniref:uncharacterized protein n=1 Tax=Penicillium angulare TaxID=116970 RepID=UPI00253FC6C0|nr:uncharacterized protein N7478_009588 [Penicillium angulare]KAJ5266780.1 hypothetical protein N7478_009588 [Penicillium angulare]
MKYLQPLIILALGLKQATGQGFEIQSTNWNSSFELSPSQLKLGNLTSFAGATLNTIINFDRTQLANGGPRQDDFYNIQHIPKDQYPTLPGQVIKLQKFTDPSNFSIPAKIAMSRIIYSTTNINGTLVPASAYVLWPFHAKAFKGRNATSPSAPVVLWTHGTSGFYADAAPSTHRGLFYDDLVPFTLAEAGYAVVAPDYAGLGVGTSWDGSFVPHQYLVSAASAGDALNALRAAQASFPRQLSKDYVVMGHSQGGSAAWRLSELLGEKNNTFSDISKYHLGTIALAPPTNIFAFEGGIQYFLSWIGKDLKRIFPSFNLSDWLTPLGVRKTELMNEVEGGQIATSSILTPEDAQPDWTETWSVRAFKLFEPGYRPVKGPLLLIQGTADPYVGYNTTTTAMEETCKAYPNDIELLYIAEGSHFSSINAARQTWLQWIEDRFKGLPLIQSGCVKSELDSFMPQEYYQTIPNSFPLWAGESQWTYELPTAA